MNLVTHPAASSHLFPSTAEGEQREQNRLLALDRLDILDTPQDEAFDRITRLAKKLFQLPDVMITMIDGHRSWLKSTQGWGPRDNPRNVSFCNHTIMQTQPLIVEDAASDPRFADNPYVTGAPFLRFYAGIPLTTTEGHNVGTLCAIDTKPREFTEEQLEVFTDLARMAMSEMELRLLANVDTLTGALSRRAFKEDASRMIALALRHKHELSCIAIDLDHFKSLNDVYGHAAGDVVLTAAVKACMEQLRTSDVIGRLGGEEFAVLLPHTGREAALEVAEKLRSAVNELVFEFDAAPISTSASLGVSYVDAFTRDIETLLKNADSALYTAKAGGRNRSSVWVGLAPDPKSQRRRVFKGGQILFNGRMSSVDCTVRSLSDHGAGVDVYSTIGIPKVFNLSINAESTERRCRLLTQTDTHLEVDFV